MHQKTPHPPSSCRLDSHEKVPPANKGCLTQRCFVWFCQWISTKLQKSIECESCRSVPSPDSRRCRGSRAQAARNESAAGLSLLRPARQEKPVRACRSSHLPRPIRYSERPFLKAARPNRSCISFCHSHSQFSAPFQPLCPWVRAAPSPWGTRSTHTPRRVPEHPPALPAPTPHQVRQGPQGSRDEHHCPGLGQLLGQRAVDVVGEEGCEEAQAQQPGSHPCRLCSHRLPASQRRAKLIPCFAWVPARR